MSYASGPTCHRAFFYLSPGAMGEDQELLELVDPGVLDTRAQARGMVAIGREWASDSSA
jgi:hypothetical protein